MTFSRGTRSPSATVCPEATETFGWFRGIRDLSCSLLRGRQRALSLTGYFQGSPSVATCAIHPLLFLRRSCSPRTAHAASAAPGGWAQRPWRRGLGGRTSKHSIRRADATCLLGSDPLDHLGQDKSGHSPASNPSRVLIAYQAPWISPQGLLYLPWQSHPSLLALLTLTRLRLPCLEAFAHALASCFTCPGAGLGVTTFGDHSLSFSSPPLLRFPHLSWCSGISCRLGCPPTRLRTGLSILCWLSVPSTASGIE